MKKYDFDKVIKRSGSDSLKWSAYGSGIIPAWIADMDFMAAPPILEALKARVDHGVFGYAHDPVELRNVIVERLERLYSWRITPQDIIFMPTVISGLNIAAATLGRKGDGVIFNTPVYYPFFSAVTNRDRSIQSTLLASETRGSELYYYPDIKAIEKKMKRNAKLFIFCNPHNPVGRAFNREELTELSRFCLKHKLVMCSDEIHCDLLLGKSKHIPIASISRESAMNSITLMAPSKTFNIPGLGVSFAVIQNQALRHAFMKASAGMIPGVVNLLGLTAAYAAYTKCDDWVRQVRKYLTANRDFAVSFLKENLPEVRHTVPEATYLLWIDFGKLIKGITPKDYLLSNAEIALSDGNLYEPTATNFARLNFGCPRQTLKEILLRIKSALK